MGHSEYGVVVKGACRVAGRYDGYDGYEGAKEDD
jgi:hypothetical protein